MPLATSNFLVPNGTFFVELVAFIIVLGVVGRYVLPPLNVALEARAEKIRGSWRRPTPPRPTPRRPTRSAAGPRRGPPAGPGDRGDRQPHRRTAGGRGPRPGQAEYERLLTSAEAEVNLARQRAVEEASAQLGEIVLDVAERIIGREVNADAHRDLIDEAISALATSTDSAGATAGRPGEAGPR